jgi:hypothetical protein
MKIAHAILQLLVMLFLRQGYVCVAITMHDGEHALSVLLSNKKVLGVLSAVTDGKSI